MLTTHWPTYDLIFFDCDSTLSRIEGIDELARLKGKEGRVGLLTNKAMDGELDLADVYGKRLKAIKPTRAQLKAVEERYWETRVEDAVEVIAALQYLGKSVFIISGGLIDAVMGFGRRLGVEPAHIRAVELEYNELSGRWWDYHEPNAQQSRSYLDYSEGPLTITSGKADIIRDLAGNLPGRRMMIGDGTSDLATKPLVDLSSGMAVWSPATGSRRSQISSCNPPRWRSSCRWRQGAADGTLYRAAHTNRFTARACTRRLSAKWCLSKMRTCAHNC